jgi:hypothetical protein
MRLNELTQLRPLFLVAMVITWSGLMLVMKLQPLEIQRPLLLVFCFASLSLAVLSGTVAGRKLVLRRGTSIEEVSALLFIITFFSLTFAIYGLIAALELGKHQ